MQGNGFFIVSDGSGDTFLTRNGSFVPDAQGYLVNSAGYYLMAAPTTSATAASQSVNSISQLQRVNVDGGGGDARIPRPPPRWWSTCPRPPPSSRGNLPSTNSSSSTYSGETTLTAYDNLGGAHTINLYFANEGGGNWEVDAYDASTAAAGGCFPLQFRSACDGHADLQRPTGALQTGSPLSIPVPGGQTVSLDLSGATQLSSAFARDLRDDQRQRAGHDDRRLDLAERRAVLPVLQLAPLKTPTSYPLANVPSPDNLTSVLGDAYQTNAESGQMSINNAQVGGLGAIDVVFARKLDRRPGDRADQHDPGAKRL